METNSSNINNNINNNTNNITVEVKIDQPKKRIVKKKKEPNWYKKWIIGTVTTVLLAISIPYVKAKVDTLFRDAKDKKIITVLNEFATELNGSKFDAYKYFSPRVERFYTMIKTNPKAINNYVNGLYREQYKNSSAYFDESTLSTEIKENGDYEASIIMYGTYFEVAKGVQVDDQRTRIKLILDKNFKIKFFRQFFD